ncbi:GNAT family N-acetyltransferase [Chitinivorax sp. B]|uniref:GNAT family N-acetyltransferase n=1 Tax=Chitinivorax sp. B TaxID=2502235 RepID=UPI0010F760D9|nr:GNAT family N-acetyltransferase [Chitinivorax sp. B]
MTGQVLIRHPAQRDAEPLRQFIETHCANGFDVATAWRVLTEVSTTSEDVFELYQHGRLSAVLTLVPTGFGAAMMDLLGWDGQSFDDDAKIRLLKALTRRAQTQGCNAIELGVEQWLLDSIGLLQQMGFTPHFTLYGMSRPADLPCMVYTPPVPLTWRRCTEADLEPYYQMLKRTFVHPGVVIPSFESTATHQRQTPGWVLADGHRLAGFVNVKTYQQAGRSIGEVASIGRDPDYQSYHLGEVLMSKALTELQQQPLDEITLVMTASNQRALALYQRFDFAVSDETDFYRKVL